MFNSFLYLYQRVGSPQSSPNIRGLFHRTWLCLKIGSETKSMNHRFPLVDDHQFPPCQLECSPHHPTSRTGCFCGSSRRAALACKCFWKCAATLCCPGNVETKTCGNFRTHVCDTSHAKILSFTYCDIMIVGHSFEDLHDVRLLFLVSNTPLERPQILPSTSGALPKVMIQLSPWPCSILLPEDALGNSWNLLLPAVGPSAPSLIANVCAVSRRS